MARPREFDEAAVLDAAVSCFWGRGFSATSVRDLAGEMGIAGASLYNAFGDKRTLFRRALEAYVERGVGARIARLADLPPRAALESFFAEVVGKSLADPDQRGCMLINAAAEIPADDPELQGAAADMLRRIEDYFRDRAAAAQAEGAISTRFTADDIARLLLCSLVGVRILARSRPEPELLRGAVRAAFAVFDASPQPETTP
jgi:TetR/AcrR family transcriptional repressor of nem operon